MELKESLLQIAERGFLFCKGGFQGFIEPSLLITDRFKSESKGFSNVEFDLT